MMMTTTTTIMMQICNSIINYSDNRTMFQANSDQAGWSPSRRKECGEFFIFSFNNHHPNHSPIWSSPLWFFCPLFLSFSLNNQLSSSSPLQSFHHWCYHCHYVNFAFHSGEQWDCFCFKTIYSLSSSSLTS